MIKKYSATPVDPSTFSQYINISSRGGVSNGGLGTPITSLLSDGQERMIFSPREPGHNSHMSVLSGTQPPQGGRLAIGLESR